MMSGARVLVLGGTAEAVALAAGLVQRGADPITSYAGLTLAPRPLPGRTRRGGFGGAVGLVAYLRQEQIAAVIDATHPFARRIGAHAAAACAIAGIPRLRLLRPAWNPVAGDRWLACASFGDAAAALPTRARALLAIGRLDLAAFAARPDVWACVRLIDPPDGALPIAAGAVLHGGPPVGPAAVAAEAALLADHAIEIVVAKNSGGEAGHAKIVAARALRLPVLMLARPLPVEGPRVTTPGAALAWLDDTCVPSRPGLPATTTVATP